MAKKQDEPQAVKEFRNNIRNKSIREIVQEARKATTEEPPQEVPSVEEKPQETPEEPKEEKAEVVVQTPEERSKELEEVRKSAEEIKRSNDELKEEIRKIQSSNKTSEEKKEEIKELKANWSGFDPKTGQKTPKDYDEIIGEGLRLTKEQTMQLLKEQFEEFRKQLKEEGEKEEAQKAEEKKQYEERLAEVNKQIEQEMEELYETGKLRKPKNLTDVNDPDAKVVKDLFDQAAAYNIEQQRQGKPLERSITKFYFLHYKPKTDQPAGADAPIAGNTATPAQQEPEINYFRDIRGKSFKRILFDAKRKLTGR